MVDELIEMAYGLAATHLNSLLPPRHAGECDIVGIFPCIPPLSMLRLLLQECMEWFWRAPDSLQRNRDPYPRLNLRILLGPLYRPPLRIADREKGLKMVGPGRFIRPRPSLVDCALFDNDVLPSDPIAQHLAKLRLVDRNTDEMDMST